MNTRKFVYHVEGETGATPTQQWEAHLLGGEWIPLLGPEGGTGPLGNIPYFPSNHISSFASPLSFSGRREVSSGRAPIARENSSKALKRVKSKGRNLLVILFSFLFFFLSALSFS